jgi:hypothetical protein
MNKVSEGVPPSNNEELKELRERLEGDYEVLKEKNRGLRDDLDVFCNLFLAEIKEADDLIPDGFSNHLEVCYDAIEKLKELKETYNQQMRIIKWQYPGIGAGLPSHGRWDKCNRCDVWTPGGEFIQSTSEDFLDDKDEEFVCELCWTEEEEGK